MESLYIQAQTRRARHFSAALAALALLLSSASSIQAQTTVPGGVGGQFAVSEGGAATYSIPLQAPPGITGMMPKLALSYSSQGGNGMAGVGWGVAGLSSIGRCPKTRAQDNWVGSVNYDINDRFCLDGQRLLLVSGTYGAANSEYRTEHDSFSRVLAYGTAGNGPAYFIVQTKAGLTMQYGNTADSRIEVRDQATVRVWALNRVADVKGNALTITYIEGTAHEWFYPTRIDYGSGNVVEFEYELQYNELVAYAAGTPMRSSHRIYRITSSTAAGGGYRYLIRYRPNSNLVDNIALCDAGMSACVPPVSFTYRAPATLSPNSLTFISPEAISADLVRSDKGRFHVGDWNGDGISDVMWHDPVTGTNRWYLIGSWGFARSSNPILDTQIKGESGTLHFGDWNGDGITDVMWFNKDTGSNLWYINDGARNFGPATGDPIPAGSFRYFQNGGDLHFGDWNADGLTDVMWYEPKSGENRWFINKGGFVFEPKTPIGQAAINGSGRHEINFGDWNGDGITDVMWFDPDSGGNRWFLNKGNTAFEQFDDKIPTSTINGSTGKLYFGDWNGDGVVDVLWYDRVSGGNRWFVHNGKFDFSNYVVDRISTTAIDQLSVGPPYAALHVADLNGDGISDVLWYDPLTGSNRWYLNNGNQHFQEHINPIASGSINSNRGELLILDWNGDGIADVGWVTPPEGSNRWFITPDGRDNVLTSITSNGNTTQISQAPLTNSAVYERDRSAQSYPRINLQMPQYVVASVDQSNGVGGTVRTDYKYGWLRGELGTGRGLLGFRWMTTTQQSTGIWTYNEFIQDWPFIGMVGQSRTRTSGGLDLKWVKNTYAQGAGSAGAALFVYPSQTIEESKDLNGAVLPTITTTSQYGQSPQYGDPTQVQISASDGSSKTTVNVYEPANTSNGNWILGRLKKATVTSYKP